MSQINKLLQKAIRNFEVGKLLIADELLSQILSRNPLNFDALYLKGVICGVQSKYENCKVHLLKCEIINPHHVNLQYNLAKVMTELGHKEQALLHYEKVVKLIPNNNEAWLNYGKYLFNQKLFKDSLKCFDKAVELKHDDADSYYNRGLVLSELQRYKDAVKSYEMAIVCKPDFAESYYNRGIVLSELQFFDEALASYKKAVEFKDNYAEAHNNLGFLLFKKKRLDGALASYDKAIKCKSDYPVAYYNRGVVFSELQRFKEALSSYDKAIELKGNFAEAYNNRGNVLKDLKCLDDSLESYDNAIKYQLDFADTYYNRGIVLQELHRFKEALLSYDKAIELKGNYAEAYNNRGNVLKELQRFKEALLSYDKAIELKSNYAEAYNNRGNVLIELKCFNLALKSYEKAVEIKSDYEFLDGTLIHTKMIMCDWRDFENNVSNLTLKISEGKKISPNLPVLALTDSLVLHRKTAEAWINSKHPYNSTLGSIPKYERKQKIKLAYYSENFNEHPVSYLIAELFELHNKNNFELIGFNYGSPDSSNMYIRASSAFDKFIDIRHIGDKEVAQVSRDMRIDIAIDLTGVTGNGRVGIFSYRAAPIQLSYLGYLGTIGADYYDYLISDSIIIPVEYQNHYVEKIIYLPSYQVNDSKREISDKLFNRAELNIPEDGFVYCCFNNNFKITPTTFDGWMRILKAVPSSSLLLLADNKWAGTNLKLEAKKRGIDQSRLVFCGRINRSEYLARFRIADLFLDTLPYNAGTTASDALWAGLPVLTCIGESFASRMAASILNSIELPELITTTQQQYEYEAIELANKPMKLKAITDKLARNKMRSSLFDAIGFTNKIESVYKKIYERYHSDLAPVNIYLND